MSNADTDAAAGDTKAAKLIYSDSQPASGNQRDAKVIGDAEPMPLSVVLTNGQTDSHSADADLQQISDKPNASKRMPPPLPVRGAATTLWRAAEYGDVGRLRKLLAVPGCDVNARSSQPGGKGKTALSAAVDGNEPGAVRLLLQHGADPNLQDGDGDRYPLHWAAAYGDHEECARLLLQVRARLDVRNAQGETPLQYASRWRVLQFPWGPLRPRVAALLEEAERTKSLAEKPNRAVTHSAATGAAPSRADEMNSPPLADGVPSALPADLPPSDHNAQMSLKDAPVPDAPVPVGDTGCASAAEEKAATCVADEWSPALAAEVLSDALWAAARRGDAAQLEAVLLSGNVQIDAPMPGPEPLRACMCSAPSLRNMVSAHMRIGGPLSASCSSLLRVCASELRRERFVGS